MFELNLILYIGVGGRLRPWAYQATCSTYTENFLPAYKTKHGTPPFQLESVLVRQAGSSGCMGNTDLLNKWNHPSAVFGMEMQSEWRETSFGYLNKELTLTGKRCCGTVQLMHPFSGSASSGGRRNTLPGVRRPPSPIHKGNSILSPRTFPMIRTFFPHFFHPNKKSHKVPWFHFIET